MNKFFAVISILGMMVGIQAFADDSTAATQNTSVSTSTTSSSKTTKNTNKKKSSALVTPQVTFSPTVVASPTPSAKMVVTTTPTVSSVAKTMTYPTATPALSPSLFSSSLHLYDRVGAPGDLRKAVALASKTLGSNFSKHDRSVFLWLSRVTDGDGRENAYLRFSLNGIELGGPRKPWIVLTGTVYEQSGNIFKVGSPVEVAVDFRDVKVDYEGTKLGEIQKGNDIADQFYEMITTHNSYQWVLIAQDRLKDNEDLNQVPAFVVNAKEGYAFLESANLNRDHASTNPADH
jgi:hypothetical protein